MSVTHDYKQFHHRIRSPPQSLDDSLASCISALHVAPAVPSISKLQRAISQPAIPCNNNKTTNINSLYKTKLQPLTITQYTGTDKIIDTPCTDQPRYRSISQPDLNQFNTYPIQYSQTPTHHHSSNRSIESNVLCMKRSRPAYINTDTDSNENHLINRNRPKSQKNTITHEHNHINNINSNSSSRDDKMTVSSQSTSSSTVSSNNISTPQPISWPNTGNNSTTQINHQSQSNNKLVRQSSTPSTLRSYNSITTSPYHTGVRAPSMSPIAITSPHLLSIVTSPITTHRPSFAQKLSLNIPTTNERINTPKPLIDGCSTPLTASQIMNPDTLNDGICYTEEYISVSARKGGRRIMQDCFSCLPGLDNNPQQYLLVLSDGHGIDGSSLSQIACQLLPACLPTAPSWKTSIQQSFIETFQMIDSHMLQSNTATDGINGGTTCTAVYIYQNMVYCAYVGDSRVVLSRNNRAVELTVDHKPEHPSERARIESFGGNVSYSGNTWRVESLNISRSLGDPKLKHKQYITCQPDIYQYTIQHNDSILIIATDGLWATMSSQQAVDVCNKLLINNTSTTPDQCSEALVEYALAHTSHDNITCIVIYINQLTQSLCHNNNNNHFIQTQPSTIQLDSIDTDDKEFHNFQLTDMNESDTSSMYVPPPIARKKTTPQKSRYSHNLSITRIDGFDDCDYDSIDCSTDRISNDTTPSHSRKSSTLITPRNLSRKSNLIQTNNLNIQTNKLW